jgi:hypothetical protein
MLLKSRINRYVLHITQVQNAKPTVTFAEDIRQFDSQPLKVRNHRGYSNILEPKFTSVFHPMAAFTLIQTWDGS